MRRASAAARSAMKVVAAASVTVGGRRVGRCCLRALGRLGPNVIEDVLGGPGSRCRRGAGFGLGFGLGCGLRSWRADGFGWLFGGGLGFWLGRGCGPRRGVGLGGGGVARGGGGFRPVWEVSPAAWGVECWMRT